MSEFENSGTPTLDEIDEIELDETLEDTNESEVEDEELDLEVDFLGKPTKLKKSEAKTAIQKGLNYDHVLEKSKNMEAELTKLKAQIQQQGIEQQKNELKQKLTDEGYDADAITQAIDNHPAIKAAEKLLSEYTRQIEVEKQKESIKNERFYKAVEKDVDELMKSNSNIDAKTAYRFIVGGQVDRLLEEEKKSTAKETLAEIQDKQKRGSPLVSDSSIAETVDPARILDKEGLALSQAFGNDPKKIAQYVKTQTKNRR